MKTNNSSVRSDQLEAVIENMRSTFQEGLADVESTKGGEQGLSQSSVASRSSQFRENGLK